MSDESPFDRLVLGLHPGAVERNTLEAAARFAKLFGLQLHAVFLENADSMGAAALPFTRELALPMHDWRVSDAGRLRNELDAAALHAEDELKRARMSFGVATGFEVRQGDPVLSMLELCGRQDVVACHVADAAFEGLTQSGARLRRAALATGVNALLLPRVFVPDDGPIAAVVPNTADPGDPALAIARRMAARAGRELLKLRADSWTRAVVTKGKGACLLVGSRRSLPKPVIETGSGVPMIPILVVGQSLSGA
jgi:hypothetical protein